MPVAGVSAGGDPATGAAVPTQPSHEALRMGALAVCVAVPWLQPFSPGPSVNVVPLSVSWACSVLALLLVAQVPRMLWRLLWVAALMVAAGWLLRWSPQVVASVAAATAVLCCAASAAQSGRNAVAKAVALGWLIAATASSVMALLQYFGWSGLLGPLVNAAPLGEGFANLRQRNQLATLTTLGLVALLWLTEGGRVRLAAYASLALLAAGNAASASRSGLLEWLAVLLLAVVCGGPAQRHWLRLCLIGLTAYVIASQALPPLLEVLTGHSAPNVFSRIASPSDCGSRWLLWSNVLELIARRPWSGWGWGELDHAHYTHLYEGRRFCDILDNAHNLPLHFAVELGLPLAVAACAFGAWGLLRTFPWHPAPSQHRMAWAAMAAIVLHSLVEYPLWYGPFQMAAGFAVGLLWAKRDVPKSMRTAPRWVLGIASAVAFAYASVDYWRVAQLYRAPDERPAALREGTLAKVEDSWLFRDQVRFAELSITPLTRENAAHQHRLALDMLHFSPEPKVIERVLDSALVLGLDEQVAAHAARFRAAFPQDYQAWARDRGAAGR